jgi:hypothetical protein
MVWRSLLPLCLLAAPAAASNAVDALLLRGESAGGLRALLLLHAATAADSAQQGEALMRTGQSFERDGKPDSAIACYQEAVARHAGAGERAALVDALLLRRGPGDATRALDLIGPHPSQETVLSEDEVAGVEGQRAWALYLVSQGDSALRLMRSYKYWLLRASNPFEREWRYRLAVLEQDHGDLQRAASMLALLAVESRFKDEDILGDLKDASTKLGIKASVEMSMRQQRRDSDVAEKVVLDRMGARRVSFSGTDGFPLSGIVFAPPGASRHRAVVTLSPPNAIVEDFDSLAAGFTRAGYATILLDVRGSGFSVDASVPLPETWRGRETRLQSAVARDVAPALRALDAAARVDTTRFLLIGVGATAPIAVEAASLDPRARYLALVGPEAAPTDRGILRARIARMGRPTFFQVPAFDNGTFPLVEALYESTDRRTSRISDSVLAGRGALNFHYDAAALSRLIRWLNESWGVAATRPTRR